MTPAIRRVFFQDRVPFPLSWFHRPFPAVSPAAARLCPHCHLRHGSGLLTVAGRVRAPMFSSTSFPSLPSMSCCSGPVRQRLCGDASRMPGPHREREQCGARQRLFGNNPQTPHLNEPVTKGTNSRALSSISASDNDGARDGTPVQLQAVPSLGRSLPVLRPPAGVLLRSVQPCRSNADVNSNSLC